MTADSYVLIGCLILGAFAAGMEVGESKPQQYQYTPTKDTTCAPKSEGGHGNNVKARKLCGRMT